jgi:hypothetical protein
VSVTPKVPRDEDLRICYPPRTGDGLAAWGSEFRPAGPVRALLRRLGRSKHGAAPGAGEWTASLARAGFADAHVVRARWASLLVLVIAARKGS